MTSSNEYPTKTLHRDIDHVLKLWKDLYVVGFTRDKSTMKITITFSERRKNIPTLATRGNGK